MPYDIKNFDELLGASGFSDQILKNHFTLYQGYVNNFNKLDQILVNMEKEGKYDVPEYAELNRRLGWEFNGMRLHELYFENISKTESKITDRMKQEIEKEFGTFEFFEKDFKSMGKMRGIGWIVLYQDGERLFNVWINEHDVGHFAGCKPLLVMDVFEHAYMLDYGLKKADYIDTFMKNINWEIVDERFKKI